MAVREGMSLGDQWPLCLDTICSGQFTLPTCTWVVKVVVVLSPAHILRYLFFLLFLFFFLFSLSVLLLVSLEVLLFVSKRNRVAVIFVNQLIALFSILH